MLTVKLAVFRVPVASITHERVTATLAGVIVQVASVVENPLPVMATIDPLSPAEGLRVMLGFHCETCLGNITRATLHPDRVGASGHVADRETGTSQRTRCSYGTSY